MSLRRRAAIALITAVAVMTAFLPATASALGGTSAPIEQELLDLFAADPVGDHVAVVSTSTIATPTLVALLAATGADVTAYAHLPMVAVRGTAAELQAVAAVPGVTKLWVNRALQQAAYTSSRSTIQADAVWDAPDLGYTGAGVTIAVLDSGIDATHQDLELGTKTVQNVKILGDQHVVEEVTVAIEDVPDTDTTTGHGTHVAGIAAGSGAASGGLYRGVAPGASLVGVGAADGIEMLTAIAGYDWILDNYQTYGIRVINNSWADGSIAYDPSHPLNVASKAAHDAGIVVVFAAGNDGQDSGDVFNRYAFPDWVISVGGGTKTGGLGDFSSRGTEEHHADVVAPGYFIASTLAKTPIVSAPNMIPLDLSDPISPYVMPVEYVPYYTFMIGTSMAAPHVAGLAALVLEANPNLTPDQVRQVIVGSATPMPGCPVTDCGAGYVNAAAAVRAALDFGVATPVAPVASVTASATVGAAPLSVTLDASASTDDGAIVAYRWDLDGDGVIDTETTDPVSPTTTFGAGVHHPGVIVVDDEGLASPLTTVEVRASNPPQAVAVVARHAQDGEAVVFDASGSTDPDGTIVTYRFEFGDGSELVTQEASVIHTYTTAKPVRLAWRVVVVDDAGLEDAVAGSIKVTP